MNGSGLVVSEWTRLGEDLDIGKILVYFDMEK